MRATPAPHPHLSPSSDPAAAAEEHFRALFESIDEGVATVEVLFDGDRAIDFRFLEVNRAHQAMSGVGPEVVGKRMSEVMPDLDPSMIERIGKVALTGEPVRFEEYIGPLDRWLEVYLCRVGQQGSRTVVSVFKDITERKRRERHAAFLDKLSQALGLLKSPEDIVSATGEALGAYLDLSYLHVVGVELDPEDEPAEARLTALAAWERKGFVVAAGAYRAGDYLSEEFLRAARAGEPVVVRDTDIDPRTTKEAYRAVGIRAFTAVPILKDDAWPGLISVGTPGARDWRPDEITLIVEVSYRIFLLIERVRAEKALSRSEEKYRSLFESIDEGVSTIEVLFDAHDKAIDYRFLEFNAAHEAMSGVPRDVIGKRGREVLGYIEPSMLERLGQVALTGQPIRFEEFVSGLGRWFDIYSARDGGSDSRRVISVFKNITERKRREEDLRDGAARARALQRRLVEAEENERRAIHRELHDRVGQDLATAKLNMELAKSLPPGEVGNRLLVALELVQSAIESSRNIMAELRPPGLDDHGLGMALKIFAEALEDRIPIAVSVRGVDLELRLPPLVEASLFRIAQEAINNLTKYAKARTAEISFVQKAHEVRLTIADDGCGFDATRLPESDRYGLLIMRERAEAVNAKLEVDSAPGRGTRITAILERTA